MSRPAVVYIVMLVVLIAGLWAVLAVGRHLNAPQDFAGRWQLTPLAADSQAQMMTIEQSGRFFQIAFEQNPPVPQPRKFPPLDLKLANDSQDTLTNKDCKLTITGPFDGDDKTIELTGPNPAKWTAHRVVRTFPADVEPKEAK